MRFISWNILYRQHAEKYDSALPLLTKYPNDHDRLCEIVELLRKFVTDKTIVSLQECHTDILPLLYNYFSQTHMIHYVYVKDCTFQTECLVTMTPLSDNYQAVYNSGTCCIFKSNKHYIANCHFIPQKYTKIPMFAQLSAIKQNMPAIIMGDFNETINRVKCKLEHKFVVPWFGNTYKQKKQIDYILLDKRMIIAYNKETIRTEMSDHAMIVLSVVS